MEDKELKEKIHEGVQAAFNERDKIYLVTHGEYSSYHIFAVFDSETKAEHFIKTFDRSKEDKYFDEMRIEEYQLNPEYPELGGKKAFRVDMDRDGNSQCSETDYNPSFAETLGTYRFYPQGGSINVLANDEQHAVKIANEKRIFLVVNGLWGKP